MITVNIPGFAGGVRDLEESHDCRAIVEAIVGGMLGKGYRVNSPKGRLGNFFNSMESFPCICFTISR